MRAIAEVLVACVVGICVVSARAVVIDTVSVGNPGNGGDLCGVDAGGFGPDRVCGAVNDTYNIGKYEVTAGQYTEFLNGVTGNYWDYPTGTNSVPSNALIDPDAGNNANFYEGGYTIGSPYFRTPVGEFENSESPYGTFDQGGNVWEWNEAVIGSYRGLRGGSFGSYAAGSMQASARSNDYGLSSDGGDSVGFRVSEVPEPATCVMLALAGLGILRRR